MTSHSSTANSGVSGRLGPVWQGMEPENEAISDREKELDEITDTATFVVNEASSSDGLIDFAESVAADPGVKSAAKAVGKAIVEGVPGFMRVLEAVIDVHPFLKVVYLPFKQIYYQEAQRRDNDQRRTELFETLKDAILVLVELEYVGQEDARTTPKGEPMLGRLRTICEQLEKDIRECYNVVDAQKKRSIAIKFLKATSWNERLVLYAALFKARREELLFAFSIKTVITMDEMSSNIKEIKETMMRMFATMLTPQEKSIELWIKQNGGEKAVLASDQKCAEMVRYEAKLTASSGQTVSSKVKMPEEDAKKGETRAIANLKKEYREGIQVIIQENLDNFSKGFQLDLNNLGKDLGNKIIHEGDRVIQHLNRGPHNRIKDMMIFHVWKDQGWMGSAKTRSLVFAIRDYFMKRVEHEHHKLVRTEREFRTRSISPAPKEDKEDEDDPVAYLGVPLPDNWAMGYLQVKRLQYLQQVIDPNGSGFTTISDINAFTCARPADWSLPRWISYWTIGWQISATRYCIQIEELFSQIFLLQKKIAMQMPGNKRYVNEYIDFTWRYVTALTSSIDRYDSPSLTLKEQFKDYVDSQEKDIKDGLEAIQYKIENMNTITSILHGKQIEQSVLVLLTLLMRRHLAKIHLCLKMEIDERELDDASSAIGVVIDALWARFSELKEHFLNQRLELKQTFEWHSCGLFKNYREWDDPTNTKYLRASDTSVWTAVDTIHELDPAELAGILVYTDKPDSSGQITTTCPEGPPSPTVPSSPIVPVANGTSTSTSTSVELVEAASAHEVSPTPPGSSAEVSIAGTWYGWHWTETERPFREMLRLNLACEAREADSEASIVSGHGTISGGWPWKLKGTVITDQLLGVPKVDLECSYDDNYDTRVHYLGTFLENRQVITGTFERTEPNLTFKGWFLFKKVPTSVIMCSRPFVAELNIRELWSFAYHAVVDNLQRKKLPLQYVYERMVTIRRMVELITREMDDAENMEMSRLTKNFSVEEIAEIHNLAFARSSVAKKSISGIWYGWHWTETRKPLCPMETFTLECGTLNPKYYTGISGNGVGFNNSPWTLEGLIRERRTGLTPEFTRYYDGAWTRYEGLFDGERASISGTFENATEKGWFLLKKVAVSAIMCSRPLEVAPLVPKDLRSFACQAVIDGIRRKKLTPLYLYNRMTHMRRVMELVWKHILNDDELPEYSKLIKPFSAQEILEIWKLYNWYHRVDVQHPNAFCDVCADHMRRTRVVCLECTSAEKAEDSVDLCAKLTCLLASSLPKRNDVTHLPSHLMMKIRDYFLLKDYFLFKQQATQALEAARALYQDLDENDIPAKTAILISSADTTTQASTASTPTSGGQEQATESESAAVEITTIRAPDVGVDTSPDNAKPTNVPQAPDDSVLKCAVCKDRIKTPCWYCIECKVNYAEPLDTWVCDSCEKTVDYMLPWDFLKRYQAQRRAAEKHNVLHPLVRVAGIWASFSKAHNFVTRGGNFHADDHDKLYDVSAHDAFHDSAERFPYPQYNPIRHMELFDDLYNWSTEDDPGSKVLWLYGLAGAGKSGIAQVLCQKLQAEDRLGGSFFFERGHSSRGDGNKLIATIAYQLRSLKNLPALREAIVEVIAEDPSLLSRSLGGQLQKLIIDPCIGNVANRTLVIVIDGLDQCENENVQLEILRSIATSRSHAPLRFFISSRPEPHIGDVFRHPDFEGPCLSFAMRDDLPEQLITAFQSADTPSTNLRPEICAKIVGLLSNPETYKQVLSRRNLSAQHLLDFLQDLLDDPSSFSAKPPLVRVLLRLSRVSGRHPRCLTVADLKKEGMQVAAGNFSDLWKGSFRGKDVSIKVMRLFETSDIQVLLQEFSREALIWRQLSHPNLLPFYGLYFLDRRLCLISPWMQNGNVLAYLNNKPAHINPLSLILDVALGLEYLHKNNVVHGDLKAINILVTPSHRACIADFGLSSITNPMTLRFTHTTVERGQGGTPRYQAPELFQDDTRHHFGSDVYAFACVCYEIIVGKIPFHEISNDMNVMLKVRDGKRPSRPFSWAGTPSVLDELWQLLQDCWNGTSELRPKANEIVERLISPPLQARTSQDTSDWDDASTSKARRALQPPPPAMTLAQLDMLISGEWCYGPCNECER